MNTATPHELSGGSVDLKKMGDVRTNLNRKALNHNPDTSSKAEEFSKISAAL